MGKSQRMKISKNSSFPFFPFSCIFENTVFRVIGFQFSSNFKVKKLGRIGDKLQGVTPLLVHFFKVIKNIMTLESRIRSMKTGNISAINAGNVITRLII